ncbi:ankyrin [Xylaria sp. FL1042]|nr:ankyrin [Xylaria sp. FL1042]
MSLPVAARNLQPDVSFFNTYASMLRLLFLEQNKTLTDVKKEMEGTYGFPEIHPKTYEYGFRHLGLVKNLPLEDWLKVEAHINKRKSREGKDTDVFLCEVKKPREKIDRIVTRNPKAGYKKARINRESTPELPVSIRLKTPPPVFASIVDLPQHDALYSSLGALFDFQQLSLIVRNVMLSNTTSTLQLLANVPTSQLWNIVAQNADIIIPSSQDQLHSLDSGVVDDVRVTHAEPANATIIPRTTTQLDLMKYMMDVCTFHANGFSWEETAKAFDNVEAGVSLIKIDRNLPALKTFFSLELPAVEATWAGFIQLMSDLRDWDAFRILVKIGLDIHKGAWARRYADFLFKSAAKAGFDKMGSLAGRLISTEVFYSWSPETVNEILFLAACQLDTATVSVLTQAGACFTSIPPILKSLGQRKGWRMSDFEQFTSLLLKAGFQIDCKTFELGATRADWTVYPLCVAEKPNAVRGMIQRFQAYFLDCLWIHGQHNLYKAMGARSQRLREQINIPGIVIAAHDGPEQLQLYLELRKEEQGSDRETILEIALCMAADIGDTNAIQSLVDLGVNPNTPRLREEHHPLLAAAENSRIDALRVLIGLGADTTRIKDYFPYVESYWDETNWQPDVVKYLFREGVIEKLGIRSLIEAIQQSPMDEDFADMVLQTSVPFDAMMDGLNLIQIAIRKRCDVDAVKFLHSRGVEVHSRPCPEQGTTMLHDAVKYGRHTSYKEMNALVEFLLEKGADCTTEWGGPTILELLAFTCAKKNYPLDLFTFLLDRGAKLVRPRKVFWHNNNPVLMALIRCQQVSDDLILRIMNSGADTHCTKYQYSVTSPHHQWTPLQAAIHEGHHEVARQLLFIRGADINAPAFAICGCTALQAACNPLNGEVSLGFVQFLLDHGANVNAPGGELEGFNALQCAIAARSMSVFCLLLDAGADVNATARCSLGSQLQDYRALDVAAYYGRLDMVDILIKKNAESEVQDKTPFDGAIDRAVNGEHHAIARMLRERHEQTVLDRERVYNLDQQVTLWFADSINRADEAEDQGQEQLDLFNEGSTFGGHNWDWLHDEVDDAGLAILAALDEELPYSVCRS